MPQHNISPKRALISVADKTGLIEFAKRLRAQGVEILSTGGTAKTLRDNGIEVIDVAQYTDFPELMGGRLKTLHPKIHGGILARRGIDEEALTEHGIQPIDLVIVNLYPFRQTIAKEEVSIAEAIEQIDIGGPTMVRAAAKNYQSVTVVVHPNDYPEVIHAIEHQSVDLKLRQCLACKAFEHTAGYDASISQYLARTFEQDTLKDFPEQLNLGLELSEVLRYGENPHQKAAFYKHPKPIGASLANIIQHQGKALSYNNYADADAALSAVIRFQQDPACVIVKHANPCGGAIGENVLQAYDYAHRCDPVSAFGGIVAFNRAVTPEVAREILSRQFVEVVLAPAYAKEALAIFAEKPNIRVLQTQNDGHIARHWQLTSIRGGVLVQNWDSGQIKHEDLNVVSKREPTNDELNDLLFAWQMVKSVKSNAIVLAKNGATIGIGAGQTSRVYAAQIATLKAQEAQLPLNASALASDAFFPFRDGIDTAAQAGVRAIIQPGGSMRDEEVIAAANEHDIAMIFTGMRHFRH